MIVRCYTYQGCCLAVLEATEFRHADKQDCRDASQFSVAWAIRGHLVEYDDETFVEHDWLALFLGHGLIPRAYDPVVDQTPDTEISQHFQKRLTFIEQKFADMKPMDAYFTHKG